MTLLFSALKTRGLSAFANFLQVLRETYHAWIADELEECKISAGSDVKTAVRQTLPLKELIDKSSEESISRKISEEVNKAFVRERESLQNNLLAHYNMYSGAPIPVTYFYLNPRDGHIKQVLSCYNEPEVVSVRKSRHVNPKRQAFIEPEYTPDSEIAYAPERLRSMQRTFERERSSTDLSISFLKREELKIRGMLKQNADEQKDLVAKQNVLSEIEEKLSQINTGASKLLYMKSAGTLSRGRLRHLEQTPWR